MTERIAQAAEMVRRSDHERLLQAQSDLRSAGEDLRRIAGIAHSAADQRQRTVKAAGIGVLIGVLFWVCLAGTIARSLPDNWQLPESMARRALGAPILIDAEARLLQAADPARWEEVIKAARLPADNREAIKRCKGMAMKKRGPDNCQLRIGS